MIVFGRACRRPTHHNVMLVSWLLRVPKTNADKHPLSIFIDRVRTSINDVFLLRFVVYVASYGLWASLTYWKPTLEWNKWNSARSDCVTLFTPMETAFNFEPFFVKTASKTPSYFLVVYVLEYFECSSASCRGGVTLSACRARSHSSRLKIQTSQAVSNAKPAHGHSLEFLNDERTNTKIHSIFLFWFPRNEQKLRFSNGLDMAHFSIDKTKK